MLYSPLHNHHATLFTHPASRDRNSGSARTCGPITRKTPDHVFHRPKWCACWLCFLPVALVSAQCTDVARRAPAQASRRLSPTFPRPSMKRLPSTPWWRASFPRALVCACRPGGSGRSLMRVPSCRPQHLAHPHHCGWSIDWRGRGHHHRLRADTACVLS